ncbi:MAG: hypothetical protein ABR568_00810 [Pyrinomonadaceae bacterium]
MSAALTLVPIERDPAQVYLAGLSPNGRRTMAGKLSSVAAILGLCRSAYSSMAGNAL